MRRFCLAAAVLALVVGCDPDADPDVPSELTCDVTPASTDGPLEWEATGNVLTLAVGGVDEEVTVRVMTTPGIVPPNLSDVGGTDMDDNLVIDAGELPFEEELVFGCIEAGPGTVTIDVGGLVHEVNVTCPEVASFFCDVTPPDDLGPLEWEASDNILTLEVDGSESDVTVRITTTPGIVPPNAQDIGGTDVDGNLLIEPGEMPFEEELSFSCDAADPGTITIEVQGDMIITHTVQVRCPDVPDLETFALPQAADTFPDAILLEGAMGSSDGTTLTVVVPYPAALARPADDEHDTFYTSGYGTQADGSRRFGECSDDTRVDGRDPTCVIFDESFLQSAQEPANISFGDPLMLELPVSASDGALAFTVDGMTVTLEFLDLFLSRRNDEGILENHVLSIDVPALVALID